MNAVPFKENPGISDVRLNQLFRWIREHANWPQFKNGVTWDYRCKQCGFTIENCKIVGESVACGNGRKIAQRATNMRDFNPVLCSDCAPF